MSALARLTRRTLVPSDDEARWKAEFNRVTEKRATMTLLQFMQITACRSRYYAVRLFDKLDPTGTGTITFPEFAGFLRLLAYGNAESIGNFAFGLFDTDGDDWLSKEELHEALAASIAEGDSRAGSDEIDRLLHVLLRLFTDGTAERVSRERFVTVLQLYPDVLGNFTIGSGARAAISGLSSHVEEEKNEYSVVKKYALWIQNNPKRALAYILTILTITTCFLWRFSRYAGDCSGADLEYVDPFLGVTRREVKERLQESAGLHMSGADAKYMSFSLEMTKHDPIGCQGARKRKLLSWTLPLAKGCGQGMKATFTLILLPVSRTLMTKLRKTFLRNLFDFDNAISYHRILGKIGFFLAWFHTLLHVVDAVRWSQDDLFKQWSFAFPRDYPKEAMSTREFAFDLNSIGLNSTETIQGVPSALLRDPGEQPTFFEILGSDFAVTGIILITTYTTAALFALEYPKGLSFFNLARGETEASVSSIRRVAIRVGRILNNFNYFWYTHQLFGFFYLAMLFHPMPHIPDERNEWAWSDSWLWVVLPVGFYLMERLHRHFQSASRTTILDMRLLPGKVVAVKTAKPENRAYLAGQYVFINCLQIAPYEWHPFTLTSAPHDPYLGVHIRAAGDWTNALYTAVKNYKGFSGSTTNINLSTTKQYPFNIRVAGPYGAPAQNYRDFGVIMCVGAGIGVTPFASIISSVLHSIHPSEDRVLKKVYFHWVVRTRNEGTWFKKLLEEIADKDSDGELLDINIHISSLKEGNDLRVMLLRLAEFEDADHDPEHGVGVRRSNINFGRPDWSRILTNVRDSYPDEPRVGVFYCGPPPLKRELKSRCDQMSRKGKGPKFVFRKEVF